MKQIVWDLTATTAFAPHDEDVEITIVGEYYGVIELSLPTSKTIGRYIKWKFRYADMRSYQLVLRGYGIGSCISPAPDGDYEWRRAGACPTCGTPVQDTAKWVEVS